MSISPSFSASFSGVPRMDGGSEGALNDSGWLWLEAAVSETGAKRKDKMSEMNTKIKKSNFIVLGPFDAPF